MMSFAYRLDVNFFKNYALCCEDKSLCIYFITVIILHVLMDKCLFKKLHQKLQNKFFALLLTIVDLLVD